MDDLVKAVKTCLNKYADFKGRAARPEFWWFALATFVVSAVLNRVVPMLGALFSLAVLLPSLAVGARRLHDIGKSGWFLLLLLIPVIGWLVLLYFYVQPSGPSNEFGEAQAAPSMVPEAPAQQ
jgi:uncharacterized membrane protein YhaH (DUF805 family)